MIRLLLIHFAMLIGLIGTIGCAGNPADSVNANAPAGTGFSLHEIKTASGDQRHYSVFVPFDYNASQKWHAIVFLHGKFEGGDDGVKCTTVGLGPFIARDPKLWHTIVIFPHSPNGSWTDPATLDMAMAELDAVAAQYSVDKSHVTLTGLSTGGEGVWRLAARFPDRFERLAPMCAYAATDVIDKLPKRPIWVVHNSSDIFVGYGGSKEMVEKINAAGGNAKLSDWGGSLNPHNCWDKAYGDAEFVQWLQGG